MKITIGLTEEIAKAIEYPDLLNTINWPELSLIVENHLKKMKREILAAAIRQEKINQITKEG